MTYPTVATGPRNEPSTASVEGSTGQICREYLGEPVVSVSLTPSCNKASVVGATMSSMLANLKAGHRYFVICGAPTDGIVDIIRQRMRCGVAWPTRLPVARPQTGMRGSIGCTG